MFRKFTSRTYYVQAATLLLSLSLCMSGCHGQTEDPQNPSEDHFVDASEMVVYVTDSTEWRVKLFKEHLLYSEAVSITLPAPFHIPSREEAQVLKTCSYPHDERFVTCDGYTFGMPSSSVSKAGQKTKYSLLGLYIRQTVIVIEF